MKSKRQLQIGITGGIGAGKSLVSKIFLCLGIPVYDADSRAKRLMITNSLLINQIKKEFGALSYHEDGNLNRPYISEQVFLNPSKLKILNNLVHPQVQEDYKNWVAAHQGCPYVLKEAALLFEASPTNVLDKIIMVYAPEAMRIERVQRRDKRTYEQIKAIIKTQMNEEEKLNRADFVVTNDETTLLIPQVLALHKSFSK